MTLGMQYWVNGGNMLDSLTNSEVGVNACITSCAREIFVFPVRKDLLMTNFQRQKTSKEENGSVIIM